VAKVQLAAAAARIHSLDARRTSTSRSKAGDRARDAALTAAGYIVLRFTWRQVLHETILVVVRIAQVLARPLAA
jgi:very-short-patch-repair endonuclease